MGHFGVINLNMAEQKKIEAERLSLFRWTSQSLSEMHASLIRSLNMYGVCSTVFDKLKNCVCKLESHLKTPWMTFYCFNFKFDLNCVSRMKLPFLLRWESGVENIRSLKSKGFHIQDQILVISQALQPESLGSIFRPVWPGASYLALLNLSFLLWRWR